jgi:prefoldin subunit 5
VLTLEEYNKQEAQKALDSGVYNTIYSNIYNSKIDINNCNPRQLNKEDQDKVRKAKENIERLKTIAKGEVLEPLYGMYYVNVYLKQFNK